MRSDYITERVTTSDFSSYVYRSCKTINEDVADQWHSAHSAFKTTGIFMTSVIDHWIIQTAIELRQLRV